ncbi:hypothetical protein [Arcobacter sp. AHV-9/2010]|uniref:hypothetical protein n=1 Tax=Arcobacter sp. AHV-9/2010 TaxID=2021861 RepID=UPI0013E96DA9|nr:hypothetical protein [Arcobacter sp. CECT 9299]
MFQKTVLNSISQDEILVATRWASFQKFLAKVEYIKTVKEEKYQDGFLVDIFEKFSDYKINNSNSNYFNLEKIKLMENLYYKLKYFYCSLNIFDTIAKKINLKDLKK